jgi:hypothetical protein
VSADGLRRYLVDALGDAQLLLQPDLKFENETLRTDGLWPMAKHDQPHQWPRVARAHTPRHTSSSSEKRLSSAAAARAAAAAAARAAACASAAAVPSASSASSS